jgi:hypothetical protein
MIVEVSGPSALDWIEAMMECASREEFVRETLMDHTVPEVGEEVGSYDPDDVIEDVIFEKRHFVIASNVSEQTFSLEEVRGG